DDAGIGCATGFGKIFGNRGEQAGRNGEVVERTMSLAELAAQSGEGFGIVIVAVDVAEKREELLEGVSIEAAMVFQALPGAVLELVKGPAGFGHADDREIESLIADEPLQGGEDLLVGQVACGAEKNQRVGR